MVRKKSISVFFGRVERQRLLAGHVHHHKLTIDSRGLVEEDRRAGLGFLLAGVNGTGHHGVEHVRRHEDGHLVGRIVVDVKEELEEDVGVIGLRLLGNYFGVDDGPHHGQQGGDGLWAVDGHWAAAKS